MDQRQMEFLTLKYQGMELGEKGATHPYME